MGQTVSHQFHTLENVVRLHNAPMDHKEHTIKVFTNPFPNHKLEEAWGATIRFANNFHKQTTGTGPTAYEAIQDLLRRVNIF